MRDGIILTVADDGTARVYYDTYDIVIHCESQEWRDKAKERIMGIEPKTTGSGFNHGEKDENWEARTTDDLISRQDAVNALDKRFDDVPMELTTEILLLRKDLREVIPSAQPETHDKRTETHVCDYSLDEWCTDCKEYDTERNCCPRFNRVIREAVKEAQPVTIIESDESIKLQNSNDTISGEADET